MNLHEYQSKKLFADYGLPVPIGTVVTSVDEAVALSEKLGSCDFVIKAQVHAGGRGKAGGVKLVDTIDEVKQVVKDFLGTMLVTIQTDSKGQPVNQILLETKCSIKTELYLGVVIDRESQRVVVMASTEGGVEIEKVAHETPEKIFKIYIDPLVGVMPNQCREVGFKLGFTLDQIKQFTKLVTSLITLFNEKDLALVEINPLVIDGDDNLLCLDAKINVDDNALYRQQEINELRDKTQEDERVNHANDWELNYIPLEGDIGCMVNGAGLAMATMDIVKLYGGLPANFLDVGGGATKDRVTEAFKIILSDSNVAGVLVNIFGGIVRCDLVADGIIGAVNEVNVKVPVVVRLEGNSADLGSKKLDECELNIISASSLQDAAKKIVAAVGDKS